MEQAIKKFAMFSILLLIITQYGYTQQLPTTSEIVTKVITTRDGSFTLQHTPILPKGQNILATIVSKATGNIGAKRLKQLKKLQEYQLKIGNEVISSEGLFCIRLPETSTTKLEVFSPDGRLVDDYLLELSDPGPAVDLKIPKTIRKGAIEKINCNIKGDLSETKIRLNNQQAKIIAANDNNIHFIVDDVEPGQMDLTFEYDDNVVSETINLVDYTLTVGKTNLLKGESSFLEVSILGLENLQEPLLLNIQNNTDHTVLLVGGNSQAIKIEPKEITTSGIWEKRFNIQSLANGSFSISTNLNTIFETEAPPVSDTATVEKNISKQTSEYQQRQIDTKEMIKGGFMDSTLKPCDSVEVDFHINTEIESLSNVICRLGNTSIDSLINAIDDYEKALWKRDSIQGMLNTANDFKNKLEFKLKGGAVKGFQEQIDELDMLSSGTENCASNWENEFYNRYVLPNPTRQVLGIYNSYVQKYKERFEKCINRTKNTLLSEQRDQENYYKRYTESVDQKIAELNRQLSEAEINANDKEKDLENKLAQLAGQLCQINIQWNALITYMNDNVICMKCGTVYINKPKELLIMDSCLAGFTNKLLDKISNLRQPISTEALKGKANDYFDLDEMDKNLQKVDSLKNAFTGIITQANQSNGNIKLVHPCCENFHELASGKYLYGHQVKIYSDEAAAAKQFGQGNQGVVIVPADPQQAGNRNYHQQYRKDRSDFYSKRNEIRWEIERTFRKLKNGCNHGRASVQAGLKDEKAMELHGAVNAAPIHQASTDKLKEMLNNFINNMGNCYNQNIQHQQHRSYTAIFHKCFKFKLCLELLDKQLSDYQDRKDQVQTNLRKRLGSMQTKAEIIQKEINGMDDRISAINSEINSMNNNPIASANTSIGQQIQILRTEIQNLQNRKSQLQTKLDLLKLKLDELKNRIDQLGNYFTPAPIASIGECEEMQQNIRNALQGLELMLKDLNKEVQDAESTTGQISEESDQIHRGISEGRTTTDRIRNHISDLEGEAAAKAEAEKKKREFEDRTKCLRLLSEHVDKQPGDNVLDSLASAYETFSETIGQLPGGYSEILDRLKDFNNRVSDIKERAEQVAKLLKGILDDPNLDTRSEAFGEVLEIGAEIGERVPGFGKIIGFYAEAYKAAIGALKEISDAKVNAMKPLMAHYTVRACPQSDWGNKSLEQITEDRWKQFMKSSASIVIEHRLTDDEQLRLKNYFKQKMMGEILDCCLKKLTQQ